MVAIRSEISDDSMTEAQVKLLELVAKRGPQTYTIYIVLDSPGGNIDSGNRTISIDVSRLASGEYNFVAVSKAGEHIQRTVIVRR